MVAAFSAKGDPPSLQARVLRDIPYDRTIGAAGLGDLYLPGKAVDKTVVLAIHGGGWKTLNRASWSGVAEFFWKDLDCCVFNIEYRLANPENRWPACGDDCVKAANWLFSDEFAKIAGFVPDKIYLCGGSAGGHLALWTLTSLPAEKVAGCISISSIANPLPDFKVHPGRYAFLFGDNVSQSDVDCMNPVLKIKSGMAPVLCTHASGDKVVPISSHRAFADAYRVEGNACAFFEYPCDVRPGLTGHCLWIPGSKPRRLIPELEERIKTFMNERRQSVGKRIWNAFANPPHSAKPWCYWWWINGHADRETITADLEAMKRLGFGGVLMFDSRGYWDDKDHVVNPKPEIGWGTEKWYELLEFSIRECARIGLEFTMNASASGGTLNGFIDGKEYEVDVMDRKAVVSHLDRAVGSILKRVPDLVGKTFTHIYSVSYEGGVKTGGSWSAIKDNLYATMREWAHGHGFKLYSESGGPWGLGSKSVPLDCTQLDLLAHNDFPQGEFWLYDDDDLNPLGIHSNNGNGRFFSRAVVLSARREGRRRISMEAFTHMRKHYSVAPAQLKPFADMAFADGANHLVWHTFTCSPKKFGIPGAEYFAGSHINRNVTWHKDAAAFVGYLARCQALLQIGEPVDDGEFLEVSTNYCGWGRFRKDENAQFTTTHRRKGDADWFFIAGEGKGETVLNTAVNGRSVEVWDAVSVKRTAVAATDAGDGKTRVALDLPVGGSCFVVFAPREEGRVKGEGERVKGEDVPIGKVWNVSFAYHDGIAAPPPAPIVMETLRDWTSFGADGDAASTSLRYFSGTATYKTTVQIPLTRNSQLITPNSKLCLGSVPTGLAHVFVNGKDCGVAWCAPWEVDIASALREGENEIEIRYTNNWYNRLVGDCFLKPEDRVTRSTLQYWTKPRGYLDAKRPWRLLPTVYSGPSVSDQLQPSGLLGPVSVKRNLRGQQTL